MDVVASICIYDFLPIAAVEFNLFKMKVGIFGVYAILFYVLVPNFISFKLAKFYWVCVCVFIWNRFVLFIWYA